MEDYDTTATQQKEADVVTSAHEDDSILETKQQLNEPETTTEGEDNIVSSTSASVDEEDAAKQGKDEPIKSVEEKLSPPAKLTSRMAVWMIDHNIDDRVIDLIYWRDIKKTAVVFCISLLILLFLVYHTLLSVISFFALSLLTVSLFYRIGMTVIGAVQKTGSQSPYKSLLEMDFEIPTEKARDIGECIAGRINCGVSKLTKLFLVEEVFPSIKFGVFLWFLSCVGKWFSAVSLLIIATLFIFSVPKLYEDNQVQVDKILCKACQKTTEIVQKVKSKVESRFQKKDKNA